MQKFFYQRFKSNGAISVSLNSYKKQADILGALASGLCLIHCLATPFLFVAQAGVSLHEDSMPTWWGLMDWMLLALSLVAIGWSVKNTTRQWIKYAFVASWLFLAAIIINEKLEGYSLPEATIYIPSFSLVILHLYNRKYCSCHEGTCCIHTEEIDEN